MTDLIPKKKRGFACMSLEQRTAIARKGGAAVPTHMRTFSRDPELAVAAGRKGGAGLDPKVRSFSTNRKLASEAGKMSHAGGRKPRNPPETVSS